MDILPQYILDNWIFYLLTLLYTLAAVVIVLVVITENRNPIKTLAWVMILLFLPPIGLILYFFLGQNVARQRLISKRNLKKLLEHVEIPQLTPNKVDISERNRPLVRLAYRIAGAPLYIGNKIEVFTSGGKKLDALFAELRRATNFIHIQYYIFEPDNLGHEIREILIERAKAGVKVRVLYDDVGSWGLKEPFLAPMRAVGIEAHPFQKVSFPKLANRINYRNHRKVVVIDGVTAFMGGMNIADRYRDGLEWGCWRDTHMQLWGPAVQALQSSFSVDWSYAGYGLLSDPIYYPPQLPLVDGATMQVVTGGPLGEWGAMMMPIVKAITSAQKSIYIQTPYFVPDENLQKSLQIAALARIDVRIMIPERSDSAMLRLATRSYIRQMLRAGVKVYFYQKGFLHAKTMVIDDDFTSIGSANMDSRSLDINFEISAFVYNSTLAAQQKEVFLADMNHCKQLELKEWKKRPFLSKVKESVVRLFSPLL